jgi:hypothetical protein
VPVKRDLEIGMVGLGNGQCMVARPMVMHGYAGLRKLSGGLLFFWNISILKKLAVPKEQQASGDRKKRCKV